MKRNTITSKYIAYWISALSLIGCSDSTEYNSLHWDSDNYYATRLENLNKVESIQSLLASAPCVQLVLMQPTACMACSKEKVHEIADSSRKSILPMNFLFIADSLDARSRNVISLLESDSAHVFLLEKKKARSLGLELPEIMSVTLCDRKLIAYHLFTGEGATD